MSFVITDQTALRAIHQAYVEKDWPEAYQLVFNEITDIGFVSGINSPKADVEAGAWLWIKGARSVNSNTGVFAEYIREYSALQYEFRTGAPAGDIDKRLQDASDDIAKAVIGDILGFAVNGDGNGWT